MNTLTGVMGGMFDPVHSGHVQAARRARECCGLQQVLLMPCGNPVHRAAAQASAGQRCAMLRLALQGEPGLQLDTRECDSDAPSRTFDTVAALQVERPGEVLCLIVGLDAFLALAGWYHWRELFEMAQVIVTTRPGYSVPREPPSPRQAEVLEELARRRTEDPAALAASKAGRILVLEADTPSLSSSLVRARLQAGASLDGMLAPAVADYIHEHQLYRTA